MDFQTPNLSDPRMKNRQKWQWTVDGIIFALGSTLGLSTVWSFPFRMMRSGGFVFLILYILFMVIFGLPLTYLELLIGQYGGLAPHLTFHRMAPITTGIGVALNFISFVVIIYYNVIIAWTIRYIFASFSPDWPYCDNWWNTEMCGEIGNHSLIRNYSHNQYGYSSYLQTAGSEYWENKILRLSGGDVGPPSWDLTLCLAGAWILVFLCFIVGVKSAAKIMYVLVALPFLAMILLFIRGVTLEGSSEGLSYYFGPSISLETFSGALNQALLTIGFGAGVLPTIGSYNRFKNFVIRDAIILVVANIIVSFLFGLVISCYIGFYAKQMGVAIDEILYSDAYFAFSSIPDVIGLLPVPTLWALLWFISLFCLGLGTQLAYVNVVLTAVRDQFPIFQRFPFSLIINGAVCFICFLIGLIFIGPSGYYIFTLIDNHVGLAMLLLTLLEIIAICYIHGFWRLAKDICLMMGIQANSIFVFRFSINPVWLVLFSIVAPILLLILLIINFANWYGSIFPGWVDIIFGWLFITLLPLVLAVIVGVLMILYSLMKKKGFLWLIRPTEYWAERENIEIQAIPMRRRGGQILSLPPGPEPSVDKVYPQK